MAVSISGTSGTWSHGSSVTISGNGFGTKATAAPNTWDDCSIGTAPADTYWADAWPNLSDALGNTTFYTHYQTPIRGVPLPHTNITRYLAGCQSSVGWALSFLVFKQYTAVYPQRIFTSYYVRTDPAWQFGGDNNFKLGAHAAGTQPYSEPYWYYEHRGPDFDSAVATPGVYTPYIPWTSGGSHGYLSNRPNTITGWRKVEVEALITNQATGYVKIWWDGVQGSTYTGATDGAAEGTKTVTIGGYARNYGFDTQFRYLADLYFDLSHQRVLVANNATLANATIKEYQIPSAWTDTSITVRVNLGQLSGTAYLFVADATGSFNATGTPVSLGGTVIVPVANFVGVPTSGQSPLLVSYTDLTSNNPASWDWNFGANASPASATTQNPSTTYAYGGAQTVVLTATNSAGSDAETKTNYISARYRKPTNFGAN